MRYFAYGSNLCVRRLKSRKADPANPRIGRLPGYMLVFNKRSGDSSKANIIKADSSSEVWGVLFDISDDKLEGLRAAEGFPEHYTEEPVSPEIDGVTTSATAYIARPDKLHDGLRPFGWYLDHIIRGAGHFGFPAEYIARLVATPSINDPDQERERRERAFWNGEDGAC